MSCKTLIRLTEMFVIGFGLFYGMAFATNTCFARVQLNKQHFGMRHKDSSKALSNVSIVDCARRCHLQSDCRAFNYNADTRACEHTGNATMDLFESEGWLYSDISVWPKMIVGTCAKLSCDKGQTCIPTTPNAVCLKDSPSVSYRGSPCADSSDCTDIEGTCSGYACQCLQHQFYYNNSRCHNRFKLEKFDQIDIDTDTLEGYLCVWHSDAWYDVCDNGYTSWRKEYWIYNIDACREIHPEYRKTGISYEEYSKKGASGLFMQIRCRDDVMTMSDCKFEVIYDVCLRVGIQCFTHIY